MSLRVGDHVRVTSSQTSGRDEVTALPRALLGTITGIGKDSVGFPQYTVEFTDGSVRTIEAHAADFEKLPD